MYQDMMEKEVRALYEFYNSNENNFNKSKNTRDLKFYIANTRKDINKPEINAYACYGDYEDKIILTPILLDLILRLFLGLKEQRNYEQMLYIALFFCISHEFSHLYFGHCQLSNTKSLSLDDFDERGFSALDYHTIEMSADAGAACRTVEKIIGLINAKRYEGSEDDFLQDCITAIQGFFFIIRVITNETQPFYQSTHHPGIARFVYSSELLVCIQQKYLRKKLI